MPTTDRSCTSERGQSRNGMGQPPPFADLCRVSLDLSMPEAVVRIQEGLARILLSQTFRSAEREKALLRYVVEQKIQGRGAAIKEYTIGLEAFGRRDSFDPRRD